MPWKKWIHIVGFFKYFITNIDSNLTTIYNLILNTCVNILEDECSLTCSCSGNLLRWRTERMGIESSYWVWRRRVKFYCVRQQLVLQVRILCYYKNIMFFDVWISSSTTPCSILSYKWLFVTKHFCWQTCHCLIKNRN